MKNILFVNITLIIFLVSASAYPQDSLYNRQIVTNNFDITLEKNSNYKSINGTYYIKKDVFENCQLVNSITDSSFNVHFNSGQEFILFKKVSEISFKGNNHKSDGIFLGVIGGFISGIGISYIVISSTPVNKRTINHFVFAAATIPALTIGGMVIGWIIGVNTYEREIFDITKYAADKKKDIVLKILLSKQINF